MARQAGDEDEPDSSHGVWNPGGVLIPPISALLAAASLVAFAFWIYSRRELVVPGRVLLASLRAASLALALLLVWNPQVPDRRRAVGTVWIALDASRSMRVGGADTAAWARARRIADSIPRGGARVVQMGEQPQSVELVGARPPAGASSRLAPVLRQALDAGAWEVHVLSDLRFSDAVPVAAALAASGARVVFEDLGTDVRDAGVDSIEAPSFAEAGDVVEVAVEVFATRAAAGDSARVSLELGDRTLAEWTVALPGPGSTRRRSLHVELPDRSGLVHWSARVSLPGDVFADDDRRVAVTRVDPTAGTVALLSLAPDFEPRFLLPVLGSVSGLPTRGWLALGAGGFSPMGGGSPVSAADVAKVLKEARVLVVHGLGGDPPEWLRPIMERARRTLVFASDIGGARDAGVPTGPLQGGEWYASKPPPSPLAGALAGVQVETLAPLTHVLPPTGTLEAAVPLLLERAGARTSTPALVLLDDGEHRSAVVLAEGFWRWAFRPEAPREAYRRLWSGVMAWLLELEEGAALAGVRPERLVLPSDAPVPWRAPAVAGGTIEVALALADSVVRLDTLAVDAGGRAYQTSLPPGRYTYVARRITSDSAAAEEIWRGTVESEHWTDELRLPRMAVPAARGRASVRTGERGSRPFRLLAWPYILLLGLLATEWIGRRRAGLR